MSHTPHELPEAFPEHVDVIHKLKTEDAHFARLAEQYSEVNGKVHRGETDIEPMSDEHMIELRKQRLKLLDEISAILKAKAAS